MLLDVMIEKLNEDFPLLEFSTNKDKGVISIPAKNNEVGGVDIQDDTYELTVYLGKFSHWHVGSFEETINEKEKAISIAKDISEFLNDLFNEKIILWGSSERGGGFYHVDEKPKSKSWLNAQHKEWTWSGEKIS
ncbi:MAG: hypothetical protein JKX92_15375 [Porticoccaceae bacterium]|nr:hypothetical protein [Porticoccaceae bacterium]